MPDNNSACQRVENLFRDIPESLPEELFTELASGGSTRILRIVSTGHTTPDGEWYDQEDSEWVVVLKGRARLSFADGRDDLEMGPGDHVLLPAHCRHRVAWTSPEEPTVWLAVHFDAQTQAG
ncbi:MAG: cupin domain-containing protein [Hyphomicrobiaceae bacterium]|nr:cupin domain-containing protein [Hyphomicrobiaceae bacterium]